MLATLYFFGRERNGADVVIYLIQLEYHKLQFILIRISQAGLGTEILEKTFFQSKFVPLPSLI